MTGVIKLYPRDMRDTPAKEKINKLIESVAGEISSPDGSLDVTVDMGVALIAGATATLHTAVGYEGKRVIVKATSGGVQVKTNNEETIDGDSTEIFLPYLHSVELLSDGSNWWIILSYSPQDPEVLATLQQIRELTQALVRHLEVITDNEDLENE